MVANQSAQRTATQNIPPLIPTQQPTILNIRNVSIAGRSQQQISANQPQQIVHTTNASNISYITTSTQQPQQQHIQQMQIQQQQQQQPNKTQQIHIQQASQSNNTIQLQSSTNNAPKYNQVRLVLIYVLCFFVQVS